METIRNAGRPLLETDIANFELRIGHRLPESYRQFLLRYNGGRPPLEIDIIDIKDLPGGEADVQVFFGIDGPISSCNLDWNWSILMGRISDWLLPIACDSFGNIFSISLHDHDYGSVVYCDFEPNAHLGGAIYYRVAPNFDAFLERIRPLESN